jgi:UPF0755 protein
MSKKILKAAGVLIVSLLIITLGACVFVNMKIAKALDASSTQKTAFEIKQGQSVNEIAKALESDKLITGSDYFKIYLWKSKLGSRLKSGTYELSAAMTIPQIVTLFTGGEIGLKSNETRVIVPEGSTNEQVLDELRKQEAIGAGEDFNKIDTIMLSYGFLGDKPAGADLQGYLFPDTYNFFKGSTMDDAVKKMLDNFDKKLTPAMRSDIKEQNKTIYDILIMASIVEKESPDKEDMPDIASVFYNRLGIGMPLQSDATINYITKEGNPMPTSDDLNIDSPFNTYKFVGLPPAPICNPGIEAIKAAIYPTKTDYFYFLMPQDGQGKTIFSKTYNEHLQNKAKYLK